MAVRIDRVEKEFILGSAIEAKTEARLRADGKSLKCMVSALSPGVIGFTTCGANGGGAAVPFGPREIVSVVFDFRGQAVAFDARVIKAASGSVELALPEAMYRSLSRRWPRVSSPKGLLVEFLLPDAELALDCPESDNWADVELPELREGLDSKSLGTLVDSFKAKAKEIASEGRVIMYKDKGPADIAEAIAAKFGRTLYVPSTSDALPLLDPYQAGRIITREMAEEFEGPSAVAQGSRLSSYLRARAAEGLNSGIWCPVIYYRYAVGLVFMANGAERKRALDFGAVDLAYEFSRILAWFLKRHGYFAGSSENSAPKRGNIIDASPAGLLAALPKGGPRIAQGSNIRLRLSLKERAVVCTGKVARRYDEGGVGYCGIAFMDLSARDMAALSLQLYGDGEDLGADGRTSGGS